MDKLGGLMGAKGEPAAAELLAREALEAKRETLGGRHPGTLASINNLSTLLMDKGDPADEPLQREALEVQRGDPGRPAPGHTHLRKTSVLDLVTDA